MYTHFAVAVAVAGQAAFALNMRHAPLEMKYDEFQPIHTSPRT